jgi:hypothetical protein
MSWTPDERRFLRRLKTPDHIQGHLDQLVYNPHDSTLSPRYVMLTNDGHCLEGCLLAAAALELQGYRPLLIDLQAHKDDHHVITVYKGRTGWGSLSKSNTTLLAGRRPYYKSIRELVMSYFDFYFNMDRKLSLYAYSNPINLNRFNHWNWRTTDQDLVGLGMSFNELPHYEIADLRDLGRLRPVGKRLSQACFLGADPRGLYKSN